MKRVCPVHVIFAEVLHGHAVFEAGYVGALQQPVQYRGLKDQKSLQDIKRNKRALQSRAGKHKMGFMAKMTENKTNKSHFAFSTSSTKSVKYTVILTSAFFLFAHSWSIKSWFHRFAHLFLSRFEKQPTSGSDGEKFWWLFWLNLTSPPANDHLKTEINQPERHRNKSPCLLLEPQSNFWNWSQKD